MTDLKGIYIVLLNWNGGRDTIACLQSLLPDMACGATVIVCDNASTDNSEELIRGWSEGRADPAPEAHARLNRLLEHGLQRPPLQILDRQDATSPPVNLDSRLVLLRNGANLGFAAGNNAGLRLALAQDDMTHVWLLNNDTLVEAGCLASMLDTLNAQDQPAVCGSVIHYVDRPWMIQCLGGNRFHAGSGRALTSAGRGLSENALPPLGPVAADLDYLSGCSMLLPRAFLVDVGLMCEDYFLYYEEIDWFTRSAGRFALLIAQQAHLYHREGSSIGSRSRDRGPSLTADTYMFRSRVLFMRRYYPQHLWYCSVHNWLDVAKRLLRGQAANARVIARELLAWRGKPGVTP